MSTAAPSSEPICTRNVPLPAPEQLPDDPETLKRMIVELVLTLRAERRDNEGLRHRLSLLLQRIYGSRNERFNPDQPLLFPECAEDAASASATPAPAPDASPAPSAKRRRGKPHGRGRPSANLARCRPPR